MRFDDSLETVLATDMSTPFGAQSAWRQLVDLIGRRRVPASADILARLKVMRADVPPPVRAASARLLAQTNPPAAIVRLFVDDEIAVAAPVLRIARLHADDWIGMLSTMSPTARSILRHRRDMPPEVNRALESFGSVDFVLPAADLAASEAAMAPTAGSIDWTEVVGDRVVDVAPVATESEPVAAAILPSTSFVSIASVALGLPVVAEALRQSNDPIPTAETPPAPLAVVETLRPPLPPPEAAAGTFQIAELVARIDAYQRQRGDKGLFQTAPSHESQPPLFEFEPLPARSFRFETDAAGVVRWIEGAARAPLIGLSLDLAALPNGSQVDGVAAGAFRRRAGFANARLVVDGNSDAAGQWRITGIPVFDRASGRFTGYRGTARRPRPDETAELLRDGRDPVSDGLRQLVHELRTPTNAIAGFAEMIESQILGPVPQAYRLHAAAIRSQADGLLIAIDDIDMAARIESQALDLRPGEVRLAPLLARIAGDLEPLARLRGTTLAIHPGHEEMVIAGDERAVERLIARLMATLVASGSAGERIAVAVMQEPDGQLALHFDRPSALAAYVGDRLLTIDAETEAEREGAPLLGTGFALRLARNLAAELHGDLAIGDRTLTLRLPAAVIPDVEQVSSS